MARTIAMVLTAALTLPATAAAHLTLQPEELSAGGFARVDVRVPNERDNAGTTKVVVQFPPGFLSASYEPVPGWSAKVTMRKLDEPAEQHGERVTEEVRRVTWTGDGKTGIVRPGEFQDFGLSVSVPDDPGATLTFKALQTYENGEVVRWIGPPDADEPAPQVTLATSEGGHGAPAAEGEAAAGDELRTAGATVQDEEGAPVWLAVVALVLGAIGLLAGLGGLIAGRRQAT